VLDAVFSQQFLQDFPSSHLFAEFKIPARALKTVITVAYSHHYLDDPQPLKEQISAAGPKCGKKWRAVGKAVPKATDARRCGA
jgi:hypothetical protein